MEIPGQLFRRIALGGRTYGLLFRMFRGGIALDGLRSGNVYPPPIVMYITKSIGISDLFE